MDRLDNNMIELKNLTDKEQQFYDSFMLRSWDRPNWKRIQANMRRAFTPEEAKIYFRMFVTNDWNRTFFLNLQGERIPFSDLDWDNLTQAMLHSDRRRIKPYSVRLALFHYAHRNGIRNSIKRDEQVPYTDYFYVLGSDDPTRFKQLFNNSRSDGYYPVTSCKFPVEDRKAFLDSSVDFLTELYEYVNKPVERLSPLFGYPRRYGLFYYLEIGNKVAKARVNRVSYVGERVD